MVDHDLNVELLSKSLLGRSIDVVVSGSIGAVESVRFVRALRRLGAKVTPWLTPGGEKFITKLALEWAANSKVRSEFEGLRSHLGQGDAVVVAPASASFIAKIVHGLSNCPASALVCSYLGQKKPVILVPNMHLSLATSPVVARNLELAKSWMELVQGRAEEGKLKFPDPHLLADDVAHRLNRRSSEQVLMTMGSTCGYIDDIRHISNYSSGMLGRLTAEELYRRGYETFILCGASEYQPRRYGKLFRTLENHEMMNQLLTVDSAENCKAVFFLASVCDYIPKERKSGKIRSGISELQIDLVATEKIIEVVRSIPLRIGMKLETEHNEQLWQEIAQRYIESKNLSHLLINSLTDVSESKHVAVPYAKTGNLGAPVKRGQRLSSKREVANFLCDQLADL